MPKAQLLFERGTKVQPELREFLLRHFPVKQIERLETLGGRLTLTLSYPKVRSDPKAALDEAFIRSLVGHTGTDKELEEKLDPLPVKALKTICARLNLSVQSNMRAQSIKGAIVEHILSARRWNQIADQPASEPARAGFSEPGPAKE
jgi:hypothetical protein